MRTLVSLVETRPETIRQDYARAMELAGLENLRHPGGCFLLAREGDSGHEPGFTTSAWQLDGVLSFLTREEDDGPGTQVFPVQSRGPGRAAAPARSSGWDPVIRHWRSSLVPVDQRDLKPVRVQQPLPSLAAVLPEGYRAPLVLSGATGLLLPTPELNRQWQLAGGVALLTGLLAGKARRNNRIPFSEVVAEAYGLAQEVLGSLASVMDGVVWGIYRQDGKPHPLIRNVILAGRDPVAVDAVAARLAGLEPRRIPWLQLCADRGLGVVDPEKIILQGRKDLLGLDFQIPEGTFGHGPGTGSVLSLPGRVLGSLSRRKPQVEFPASAWGRLLAQYRSGDVA